MAPLSPQESIVDLLLNPGAWLLAGGGILGIVGFFLPWAVSSGSDYYAEFHLLDMTNNGMFPLIVPALLVAALACVHGLLSFGGKPFPTLSRAVVVSAPIIIILALLADAFGYAELLSPPFIMPHPAQGQALYILGSICAMLGSLIELSSWNADQGPPGA